MIGLKDALPDFFNELRAGLMSTGREDVVAVLEDIEIANHSSEHEQRASIALGECGLSEAHDLLARASRSAGQCWLDVRVERGCVELRLDDGGRPRSLEVFARSDVRKALETAGVPHANWSTEHAI